jgi:uncharacterized membrane protein
MQPDSAAIFICLKIFSVGGSKKCRTNMSTPTDQIDHEVSMAIAILALISIGLIIAYIVHHHGHKRKNRKPRKH